ncbi:sensor histidine kinase [Gaopeijia maritima]|uniref:Signal transduction histidine kinase dimerisation/phosphoacceptor domain-containing protein n=1 Tax=Gaopeijia maritima TaxID=3119007 RepID=A0ABU9ECR0_9BACT
MSTFDGSRNGATSETIPATERVLSGFCHDLNGQLANASGFLYLLGSDEAGEGPRGYLREALDRMEELVRQLRWLARDGQVVPEPVSTADLVASLEALLTRLPRFHNARVERTGPTDLPATRVDFHAALRVLLTAVDAGTAPGDATRVGLVVEVDDEEIRIGPDGPVDAESLECLAAEAATAGLNWSGGREGVPLRVQLPRL